jgi:hypothetical protein
MLIERFARSMASYGNLHSECNPATRTRLSRGQYNVPALIWRGDNQGPANEG